MNDHKGWERVYCIDALELVERFQIPEGWLYRTWFNDKEPNLVFVPS